MTDPKLSGQPPHSDPSPAMRFHGTEPVRGLQDVPRSTMYEGRFGRMFRNLSPLSATEDDLKALAALMVEPEDEGEGGGEASSDNPGIPAGFTYFGQFIDHDITFDPNSKLQRENDPDALRNFRTPRYDLDSVYSDGPSDSPYLYKADGIHLLVDETNPQEHDLPRNLLGRALTGDPRNDENAIISQLQLAFLKFHNKVVDIITPTTPREMLFDEARRIVRWHYQWIVIHDFLFHILGGDDVVNDIIKLNKYKVPLGGGTRDVQGALDVDLKFYKYRNQPFMPVEFSVAAYRFGHSMVRGNYSLNAASDAEEDQIPIFGPDPTKDLRGFQKRRAGIVIEWPRFFEFVGNTAKLQPTRKIDTKLSFGLSILPDSVAGDQFKALAVRNLLRSKALGLPSGQAVARAMGMPKDIILSAADIKLTGNLAKFNDNTPLWFYILKEAEVRCQGKKLGPVGGRIVAEVLLGLLDGDPQSFLNVDPLWQPKKDQFGATQDGKYLVSNLLHFAGVA
jgi:hypothetical protein